MNAIQWREFSKKSVSLHNHLSQPRRFAQIIAQQPIPKLSLSILSGADSPDLSPHATKNPNKKITQKPECQSTPGF